MEANCGEMVPKQEPETKNLKPSQPNALKQCRVHLEGHHWLFLSIVGKMVTIDGGYGDS